jgi:suppressor for copper-sensitivity B
MDNKFMKAIFKAWFICFTAMGILGLAGPLWAQSSSLGNNQNINLFGPAQEYQDIVKLSAQFTAPSADQPARLFVTARIKKGWHVYSITQAAGGPIRTQIKLNQSPQYRLSGAFQALAPPKKAKQPEAFGDLVVESHAGTVTWHAPMELASGVDPKKLKVEGQITVQPCDADTCLPPQQIPFTAALGRAVAIPREQLSFTGTPNIPSPADASFSKSSQPATSPNEIPAVLSSPPNPNYASGSAELSWQPFTIASFKQLAGPKFDEEMLSQNLRGRLHDNSLWSEMLLGFIGGIILNLMPCVLPVIGLKIISFVEQAGKSRLHAFFLNLWYSAGLISVFLLLAALAVFANLGWGQLFSYPAFNVAMAAIVFSMGLSFMGVWEIPIPGFIGSGKTAELAEREGFSGAFAKGVVTTILATPCTGPFMASALAWAVSQPPRDTFLVFGSVGVGMASPYLLIGAFPQLMRWLPKPGAWMDTFKQIMGFVLMATVVYIFTFLDWAYIVPTIGLLMAFLVGCWWIGRTPLYADFGAKLWAWLVAAGFVTVVWVLMFPGLNGLSGGRVPWNGLYAVMESRLNESYQRQLQKYLEDKGYQLVRSSAGMQPAYGDRGPTTIVVDFTADWCATCKTLEATVLDTEAVRQKIEQNGVVMMKADWTRQEPQVTEMLDLLGARQVPTLAIFPAGDPNNPILFRGWYGRQDLLKALDEAGPSSLASNR